MLRSLSIRNIVLIETLDLELVAGLNVLTGETGAGKSILMDALAFALGLKVRRDLLRQGSDHGSVTAEFELSAEHPALALLPAAGLDEGVSDLLLRRSIGADGRSRAFVNDQRVSAPTLSEIGAALVEIHGQHDDRGLLDPRGHRTLLDEYADLEQVTQDVSNAWGRMQAQRKDLATAREAVERAAADADFIRHSVDELEALAAEPGEDAVLDSERRLIRQAGQLKEEITKAAVSLSDAGAEGSIVDAVARLSHLADRTEGRVEKPISALDRALTEIAEAQSELESLLDALTFDPGRLEDVEERLFAMRGLARKHNVQPDDLAAFASEMTHRLRDIDEGDARLDVLADAVRAAEQSYASAATLLTARRRDAAGSLDAAVSAELPDLKMESAVFLTEITAGEAGPTGVDAVRFTARINPGAPAGPIDRIASGGELSRFLLALKVQLATQGGGQTMIFDEIDRGVGGATANAVGRRLSRLSKAGQVLVVTHAPQVAARGDVHFRIAKADESGVMRTHVQNLSAEERVNEIARMLAGDRVTTEARSAAQALIDDR
ncbi:MAG: DNA repair protein RecN [Pseudomonadota bacterium]